MLAGGLSPENVREAIERVRPWAVDASSSLETEPGVKDHDRDPRLRGGGAVADLRRLRRPLRPRDADPGARRARGRLAGGAPGRPAFQAELDELGRSYAGRPTPLTLAERFAPGKRLYLKREDLLHTGAHKLNNALGQALLALRLGKRRIVAETGAGQHGVATATVCARFGLECVVYMGAEDMRRQRPNVERMGLLGAEVRPVEFGTRTLKEATSEAIRDWITNVETTHYLIGSCVGPEPYPEIVRELQAVIGREAREQLLEAEGRLPEVALACVGGGSNAIGLFAGFLDDADVRLVGVEAAGAASLGTGRRGVLHGARSSILADEDGQMLDAHSISAGLDYPGVGPEHAFLRDTGRAEYVGATDEEALAAFRRLARTEGIIPALEPAHALARVAELDEELVLVCLSGRGDKDLEEVLAHGDRMTSSRRTSTSPSARTSRSCASRTATRSPPGPSTRAATTATASRSRRAATRRPGPFYVEGAEPGDTLAVRFDRIRPNRAARLDRHAGRAERRRSARSSASCRSARAAHGLVGRRPRAPARRTLDQTPPTGLEALGELPLDPMLGCFGVAPPRGQAISTATSGEHGGNMDYRGFREGVTVYFPVFVAGRAASRRRRPRAPGRRRDRRHRHRDLVRRRSSRSGC